MNIHTHTETITTSYCWLSLSAANRLGKTETFSKDIFESRKLVSQHHTTLRRYYCRLDQRRLKE